MSLCVVIFGRNCYHDLDLGMGFRNGIFQCATSIVILMFLHPLNVWTIGKTWPLHAVCSNKQLMDCPGMCMREQNYIFLAENTCKLTMMDIKLSGCLACFGVSWQKRIKMNIKWIRMAIQVLILKPFHWFNYMPYTSQWPWRSIQIISTLFPSVNQNKPKMVYLFLF